MLVPTESLLACLASSSVACATPRCSLTYLVVIAGWLLVPPHPPSRSRWHDSVRLHDHVCYTRRRLHVAQPGRASPVSRRHWPGRAHPMYRHCWPGLDSCCCLQPHVVLGLAVRPPCIVSPPGDVPGVSLLAWQYAPCIFVDGPDVRVVTGLPGLRAGPPWFVITGLRRAATAHTSLYYR